MNIKTNIYLIERLQYFVESSNGFAFIEFNGIERDDGQDCTDFFFSGCKSAIELPRNAKTSLPK